MAMSGEDKRFESIAKRLAEKKMMMKGRSAAAASSKKQRPGESDAAFKKRLKTITYGNPNE